MPGFLIALVWVGFLLDVVWMVVQKKRFVNILKLIY